MHLNLRIHCIPPSPPALGEWVGVRGYMLSATIIPSPLTIPLPEKGRGDFTELSVQSL
jgi:hypothetical protein